MLRSAVRTGKVGHRTVFAGRARVSSGDSPRTDAVFPWPVFKTSTLQQVSDAQYVPSLERVYRMLLGVTRSLLRQVSGDECLFYMLCTRPFHG